MGSLQLRLFLSYLFIMAATLGLFGLSLFLLLGGYRDDLTYQNLDNIVGLVEAQANEEANRLDSLPPDSDPASEPLTGIAELALALRTFLDSESGGGEATSVAFVDRDGNVIDYASPLDLEQANTDDVRVPEGADVPSTVTRCRMDVPDANDLLCVSKPLSPEITEAFPETRAVALVVAKPAASLTSVLDDLLPRLWFSALFGVAAALLLAAILARSIGAPLRNIARAARSVARGNYRQRVPATGPPEVRNLAADFNHMTGEVQRSQDTLRDFLMNISHELKTPLTSIRGFSDAILDGTIDDPRGIERSARIISNESNRVLRLVAELLELSRIESGQISMQIEEMDVSELLEHMGHVFELRGEEAGIKLTIDAGQCGKVRGDFERLEQVMNNLLDNAFRHTPAGGTVHIAAAELQPGVVSVAVRNEGPAIPESDLPHLFDRFYRASNGNAPKGKGCGLGLAICREIVRAHGGEIWATSNSRDGTTFAFTLPTVYRRSRRLTPV